MIDGLPNRPPFLNQKDIIEYRVQQTFWGLYWFAQVLRLADTAILRHLIQRTFVPWRKMAMAQRWENSPVVNGINRDLMGCSMGFSAIEW